MAKEFATPSYPHDKEKYEAICRWLKRTPLTLSNKALPEFLYQNIANYLAKKDGAWVYDKEKFSNEFMDIANSHGAALTQYDVPPAGMELLMKHIYIGMLEAATHEGYVKFPHDFTVSPRARSMGIGLSEGQPPELLFLLSPNLAEITKLITNLLDTPHGGKKQLTHLLTWAEDNGYKMQADAHYHREHFAEIDTPEFLENLQEFRADIADKKAERRRQLSSTSRDSV